MSNNNGLPVPHQVLNSHEFDEFYGVDLIRAQKAPKFEVGERALLDPEINGGGEVEITAVHSVPAEQIGSAAHTQWLEYSKEGKVWDHCVDNGIGGHGAYVSSEKRIEAVPTTVSGRWFKKIG